MGEDSEYVGYGVPDPCDPPCVCYGAGLGGGIIIGCCAGAALALGLVTIASWLMNAYAGWCA